MLYHAVNLDGEMSAGRAGVSFTRLRKSAADKNLPYSLVEQVFRLIIDEVVRNHDALKEEQH